MHAYYVHAWCPGWPEEVSASLELGLQGVVTHSVGAGVKVEIPQHSSQLLTAELSL